MMKAFLVVVVVLISSWIGTGWGTTWYVRPSTGEYGAEDGTTYATAFDGFGDIVWGGAGVVAGDTLYVCGTHEGTYWEISAKAFASDVVVDGACPSDSGIIDSWVDVDSWDTAETWTDNGSNVWYLDTSGWSGTTNPYRMWFDGTEGQQVLSIVTVTAAGNWYYDSAGKLLYVYSTSNPASAFTAMKCLHRWYRSIFVTAASSHLRFQNLTVKSGYGASLQIYYSTDITVDSNTIGEKSGGQGVLIVGNTGTQAKSEDITVSNNTIDSGFELDNTLEGVNAGSDGIKVGNGVDGFDLNNNTITNWGHSAIFLEGYVDYSFTCGGSSCSVWSGEIYSNDISGPDIEYGNGISSDGAADLLQSINIYKNTIHDIPTGGMSLSGKNIDVYHNIIYNVVGSLRTGKESNGAGVTIRNYLTGGVNLESRYIDIYNNTIYHTQESGIRLGGATSVTDTEHCNVRNNILFETAYDSDQSPTVPYSIQINDDGSDNMVHDLVLDHNIVYNSARTGSTDDITYYDVGYTLAEFDALDTSALSNTIEDNIQADPLLLDTANDILKPKPGSPAWGNGIDVGLISDFLGNKLPGCGGWPIGAYAAPAQLGADNGTVFCGF